jgi:hypothetical protein
MYTYMTYFDKPTHGEAAMTHHFVAGYVILSTTASPRVSAANL